jgi:hypothetical protein
MEGYDIAEPLKHGTDEYIYVSASPVYTEAPAVAMRRGSYQDCIYSYIHPRKYWMLRVNMKGRV